MAVIRVLKTFKRRGELILPGTIIDVPADVLPKLAGMVELIRRRHDPPSPRAWLEDGELRICGVVEDLAGEIVKLTADDLALQRRLLIEHCQQYGPAHFPALVERWEERAAIMEYDAGLSREAAETAAAKFYNLSPWLPELRRGTLH